LDQQDKRNKNKDLVVVVFKKPLWKLILAALIYTAAILASYEIYKIIRIGNLSIDNQEYVINAISIIGYAFIMAILYSAKNTKYFDFKNNKYKNEYNVAFIKIGWWKDLPDLKYIAVFRKDDYVFEVNLWHSNNKHFTIYTYDDEDDAMKIGKKMAIELSIDLFDATQKGNFKWIDKE